MSVPPFPRVTNLSDTRVRAWFESMRSFVNSSVTVVSSPTVNNFASLDANGEIQDSGYDSTSFVAAADGTPSAIIADASGRQFRQSYLLIADGTNANTLKCTLSSLFNGDSIAVTDNISKGGTTGNYSLNAGGTQLTIEASGLTGNAVMAQGTIRYDESNTTNPTLGCYASGNDILVSVFSAAVEQDLTALVDLGAIHINILYLTDA